MEHSKEYQCMVFSLEKYAWNCSKSEARALMWKDISNFLQILLSNQYLAVVYDDDTDIIVVQYEHNNRQDDWGSYNPYWITEDEYYLVEESRISPSDRVMLDPDCKEAPDRSMSKEDMYRGINKHFNSMDDLEI